MRHEFTSTVTLSRDGQLLGAPVDEAQALALALNDADELDHDAEYEIVKSVKYIVKRRITGPDAPALGPVLTISSSALTVTLDRPATGPTQISRYELERLVGSTWTQIASGIAIFSSDGEYPDTGLLPSTTYQYRARAVDTTSRASEYSYAVGTTAAGVTNTAPVWQSGAIALSLDAGSSAALSAYCSDAEGDQITYTLLDTNPNDATISVSPSGVLSTTGNTPAGLNSVIVRASDGALTANKTIALTVNAVIASTRTYYAGAPFEYSFLSPTPSDPTSNASGVLYRKNGGANVLTLPITQVGTTAATSSTASSASPISSWSPASLTDTHIVTSETITEGLSTPEIVLPREGTYFWRQKIYRASGASYASPGTGVYPTKHYDQLNSSTTHTTDGSTCRPRNAMSFQREAVYGFDRDAEVWMGFSLYIPTNWEHETYARGTTANGPMMLTLLPSSVNSLDTNSTHLTLNAIVPDSGWTALNGATSGATKTHWCIQWYHNPASTQEANVTRLSLGEIQLGKWTDFVLNMRWNPFTSNTTVLGTTYVGNAGKIRLWCGARNTDGTRSISSGSPLYTYSGPCGNYPSGKIIPSLRVYMFGWNNANTSSRSHPVWVGADSFRWGFASGATMTTYQGGVASGFSDVAPGNS